MTLSRRRFTQVAAAAAASPAAPRLACARQVQWRSASVLTGTPADFGKFIASEIDKWGKVIRFANIKAE